ncbi:MAG: AarF/UbiB family protein [Rhodothermales bacterium]
MLTSSNPPPVRAYSRRFRLLAVYGTALRIVMSYLGVQLAGMFRSPDWKQRRLPAVHRINARRVEQMIVRHKGLFIKVGQLISILTNFLPEDFRAGLEGLQDQIPPRPFEEIERRILLELGDTPDALFAEFERDPVASASLAQVHRARLADGRLVAVKVQHVDIEAMAKIDLRTIRNLLGLISAVFRVRGLDTQYQQLEAMIAEELDFEQEARNIEQIAACFTADPRTHFPTVVHERSSRRILTTEFIEGVKVTHLAALDALGIDRASLAEHIVRVYCQMIFTDGIYHADPHPGNILVRPDGSVVFLDFGAVATLSPEMKAGIPEFLSGALSRDPERITRALRQMGFIAHGHGDAEATARRLIDYVHEQFLSDLPLEALHLDHINAENALESKMEMIADLRRMNISIRELTSTFQVPKDWMLLERTMLLLLGLCTHLHPSMNPMTIIQPYLEEVVLGKDRDWTAFVGAMVRDVARTALSIPDEMHRLLVRANQGELEVRIKGLRQTTNLVYALGHQFLFGMLALGAGALAFNARSGGDPAWTYAWLGIAVACAALMAGTYLSARKWLRD